MKLFQQIYSKYNKCNIIIEQHMFVRNAKNNYSQKIRPTKYKRYMVYMYM